MGRNTTGSITTGQAMRIELNYLFKNGYLVKNSHVSGNISWNNGSKISIQSVFTESQKYIILNYTVTDRYSGQKSDYEETIYFDSVPSNLGKGHIYYFICPESGQRCKILYMCYGSHKFKARKAYKYRIYYFLQVQSKKFYNNERYFQVEKKLNKLGTERKSYYYNGQPTKRLKRKMKLQQDLEKLDSIRFEFFSEYLAAQLMG